MCATSRNWPTTAKKRETHRITRYVAKIYRFPRSFRKNQKRWDFVRINVLCFELIIVVKDTVKISMSSEHNIREIFLVALLYPLSWQSAAPGPSISNLSPTGNIILSSINLFHPGIKIGVESTSVTFVSQKRKTMRFKFLH